MSTGSNGFQMLLLFMGCVAHSKNPGLCLCSIWGPNWICAWMPPNSQALSKDTGWEPFKMSSRACKKWKQEHPISLGTHGWSCRWQVQSAAPPGSHLHVKQIELDWVSGVHVLVRVEELAPEEEGLVVVHPLLSEGPAVIQPVHWQQKTQPL